jgi:Na+-driven multidrug efflux pump
MYFIAIACAANIIIDLIFMGIFNMGAAGAALGTVLSQTISVFSALFAILKKDMGFKLDKKDFSPDRHVMKGILSVGIPVSLQDGLIQVSFIIITIIANGRGVVIAAAVGIVEKIIGFLFLIPSAMLSSISAIAAQNIGAGDNKRARETLKYGLIISVSCGLIFALIFQFISAPVVGLFTDDAEVVIMGTQYLRSYVFDCAAAGIHFCFSGFFCAHGKSIISFIHNISSIVLVRIPGAYLASKLFPDTLFEMGIAAPLGSLLSAVICVVFYVVLRKRKQV